jgi:hypothetical protein
MRDVHQLWNLVMPVSTNANTETHKLDSIDAFVLLDEIIDVTVIQPLRDQREL